MCTTIDHKPMTKRSLDSGHIHANDPMRNIRACMKTGMMSEELARHLIAGYLTYQITGLVTDQLEDMFKRTFK